MRSFCRYSLALAVASAFVPTPAGAEPLWAKLTPGQRVPADPNEQYLLTDEHGPWLIMATTFSGDGAEEQADELILELRRRYKLEAYRHEMTFDFTEGVAGRGIDRTGQPLRMRYFSNKEIREIAVLVGKYASATDPEAQTTLAKIKRMKPDVLDADKRKTTQTYGFFRAFQKAVLPADDERTQRGPMAKAFVTRNPLLPQDFFTPKGVDDFLVKINSDVKYSLLKAPGKFTVKVATYTGRVVLDQKEVKAVEEGEKQLKGRLEKAGDDAENLTEALRSKGYEAYVFHDRHCSFVTIGSFDSYGTPRADGKIEIHPKMHTIMQTFQAGATKAGEIPVNDPRALTSFKPKAIGKLVFDVQPQIVEIPQQSLGRKLAGN